MCVLGVQSIYYGPSILGPKNPTTSGGAAAASVSTLSSQLNDPCKIIAIYSI